jgi:curved DNA-binding protein CbpA
MRAAELFLRINDQRSRARHDGWRARARSVSSTSVREPGAAMQRRAFEILGIDPTTDQEVIRRAFVRLARIYHPDRFAGMPEDVRLEAERRMKQATVAYETLLAADRSAAETARSFDAHKHDAWETARRARDAMAQLRAENETRRKRWHVWEQLERQARERADLEAKLAGVSAEDVIELDEPPEMPRVASNLSQRLDQARAKNGAKHPARRR